MTNGNGDEERKETEFEKFKQLYARYITSKKAASANDSSGRVDARNIATSFYAEQSQNAGIDENTIRQNLARIQQGDQFYIDSLLDAARNYHTDKFSSHFKPDTLEAIVADAPEDKLTKNFIRYQPIPIEGNDWHNERAKVHNQIMLYDLAGHGDEHAEKAVRHLTKGEFVEQMLEKLKNKLKDEKDLSDKTKGIVLNAMALNYSRLDIGFSEEVMAKYMVDKRKKLVDELGKMFKDDAEKAKYAVKNIVEGAKTLMQQGEEGFDKAAHMVASIDS